jgi:hypothetical protein
MTLTVETADSVQHFSMVSLSVGLALLTTGPHLLMQNIRTVAAK